MTPTNSFGAVSSMGQQNQNSKLFGLSQMQNRGASNQRFPNVGMNFTNFNNNMPQFTQKMNTPYVQQPMQTGGITISLFNFSFLVFAFKSVGLKVIAITLSF